ncbi:MAG TPA: hypothetical protein VFV08_04500, partial [Puia sp.]|nr:hypothetical protein [Puia sp.]
SKIAVYGRVPLFFYILHVYLIHLLAIIGVLILGHKWTDMILTTWVSENAHLKGFGYSLFVVYLVWILVILLLYPVCKWYDQYKRTHVAKQKWLSYL